MDGLFPSPPETGNQGRMQAPGALATLQAFVNTWDIEAGVDRLSTTEELAAWLIEHELPGSDAVDAEALARAREVREALRYAVAANAHPDPEAGARLTRAAATIPLGIEGSVDGPRLRALGAGVDAALGELLAIAAAAAASGAWSRLKVCRNDACRWAYWDASRNRSGVWCTMAICGNRAKGRAFRGRARDSSVAPAAP